MSRRAARTEPVNRGQARVLADRASALVDAAELLLDDDGADVSAWHSAATAVAVIAGIAAADAICAVALGERSRSQDHRVAVEMLKEAVPGNPEPGRALSGLLDLKDQSQYGYTLIKREQATGAVRRGRLLLEVAKTMLAG